MAIDIGDVGAWVGLLVPESDTDIVVVAVAVVVGNLLLLLEVDANPVGGREAVDG
eukprot:Awhi_evm1s8818